MAEPDYAKAPAEPREIHIVVKDAVSTDEIEEEEQQEEETLKDPRNFNGDLEDMALASQSTELLNQQFHQSLQMPESLMNTTDRYLYYLNKPKQDMNETQSRLDQFMKNRVGKIETNEAPSLSGGASSNPHDLLMSFALKPLMFSQAV